MLLEILAAGCAIFAVAQLVLVVRIVAHVPRLPGRGASPPPARWPRVSVIVPARNEAAGLERALATKLSNGYPDLEVVLVDDRSTDATPTIAARMAEGDPRLVVERIAALPPGWLGKLHAMSIGVARATGEWILLSDADVHIEPGALERAVAHAEADRIDFVAILARTDRAGLVLDAGVVAMLRAVGLLGRTWLANDDRSPIGVGIGAFNLVRRSALDRTPGLVHLRMEIADDVALGAMLKACGARCRLYAGGDDVHLTFADSLSALSRTSEKGGALLGFSLLRAVLVPALWLAFDLAVPLTAVAAGGAAAWLGGIALVALTTLHVAVACRFTANPASALLWPVGVALLAMLSLRSGALAWWRNGVVWRGTYYGRDEVEAARRFVAGRVRM
jgi:glycosyl transferase family 2